MNRELKEKICHWVVQTILGKDMTFTMVRKGYLKEIARDVARYPDSKITALRILRLDGTSFKDAMALYEEINELK